MSEVKLQEGIIYMIDSYDTSINGYYVGSTIRKFSERRSIHKFHCNTVSSKKYNQFKYVYIRDNGGWNNFKMTIIERVKVKTEEELRMYEQSWIDILKPNLNKMKAFATQEDIRLQYIKDAIKYRAKHRDIINSKQKAVIQCDRCDKTYTKSHKLRHIETKYCINYNSNKSV